LGFSLLWQRFINCSTSARHQLNTHLITSSPITATIFTPSPSHLKLSIPQKHTEYPALFTWKISVTQTDGRKYFVSAKLESDMFEESSLTSTTSLKCHLQHSLTSNSPPHLETSYKYTKSPMIVLILRYCCEKYRCRPTTKHSFISHRGIGWPFQSRGTSPPPTPPQSTTFDSTSIHLIAKTQQHLTHACRFCRLGSDRVCKGTTHTIFASYRMLCRFRSWFGKPHVYLY